MATDATVGRCKVESTSLSGCAWVERISLQFFASQEHLFHSVAGLKKKKRSMFGAVEGFIADVLNVFTGISRMLWCDNGDAGRAAAAFTDNTAALLLICSCCHFVCVCVCLRVCAGACVCVRDADVKAVNYIGNGWLVARAAFASMKSKKSCLQIKCFTFHRLEVHFDMLI